MKKSNVFAVRIPEDHPFWNEKDKKQVILDALELYYATKAVISGKVALQTLSTDIGQKPEQETGLFLDKKSVKSMLDAFSKL